MSTVNGALVDHKLVFAKIALNAARDAARRSDIQSRQTQHAHLDAAVNHLCQSLAFFLLDLAECYRLVVDTRVLDARVLLAELDTSGLHSAEVAELRRLAGGPGWLADMLAAGRDPLILAGHFKPATEAELQQVQPGLIPLQDVSGQNEPTLSPIDLVNTWFQQWQNLLERLRLTLLEE